MYVRAESTTHVRRGTFGLVYVLSIKFRIRLFGLLWMFSMGPGRKVVRSKTPDGSYVYWTWAWSKWRMMLTMWLAPAKTTVFLDGEAEKML